MKRLVLSVVTAAMLATSAMSGQAAPVNQPVAPTAAATHIDWKRSDHHRTEKRAINRKKTAKRNHWKRGQRYAEWRQHRRVNDWRRHHLRRPGHGQQWVRVGNDYLLVSMLSGVIAGIAAAR